MCGDCNNDGKVLINELVSAVNNALNPPFDCTEGCFDTGICPNNCGEFPTIDGITCATSICIYSESQLRACIQHLHETTNQCWELP